MQCSVCQSTNLVKVSLAYEQGFSEYKGQARSHGFSLGTGGMGLWAGRSETSGTFQSHLSARLNPPMKWSYWKTTAWWFAGFLVLWFVAIAAMPASPRRVHEYSQSCGWIAAGYAGALALLWFFIWRYNHRVFPIRRKRWERSFMCRRCGNANNIGSHGTDGEK